MAVAVMDQFALAGLIALILVALLAYGIEALGVNTGFPFGAYHYTNVLAPLLPGGVPLAVIFAWVMILFSVQGVVYGLTSRTPGPLSRIVLRSLLTTLLDMLLEPVAFHLEHYWNWLSPGFVNFYGVPISNFVAWFVISFLLFMVINTFLAVSIFLLNSSSFTGRLPMRIAPLLYTANVFMFGLIDLTHGYYWGVALAVFAGLLLWIIAPFPRYSELSVMMIDSIEKYQPLQRNRKRVKRTKRKKRR